MKLLICASGIVFSLQILAGNGPVQPSKPLRSAVSVFFIENKGQVHDQYEQPRPDVLFTGNAGGLDFHLRTNGISYQLLRNEGSDDPEQRANITPAGKSSIYRVDLDWPGCSQLAITETEGEQEGYCNFFKTVCPNGIYKVRTFSGVTYKELYPGIDLHYYGRNGSLKYDYLVSTGADYKKILIEIKGASAISIKEGMLHIETPFGEITEHAPLVMQDGNILPSKWILNGTTLSFDIKGINPLRPFTIDPAVRVWGTYYGYSSDERVFTCKTDRVGSVYMAGEAASSGLATFGAHQVTKFNRDAFLVKFNSAGARKWCTYYGSQGGPNNQGTHAWSCATDSACNIIMAGSASASNGTEIATLGSHQPASGGKWDAFVVKFDSTGVRQWGTYFGSSEQETGEACSTDPLGNIYLVGGTNSTVNIATLGSHQPSIIGTYNAFIVKFNGNGVQQWATYYGTDAGAQACATDLNGNVFVAGGVGYLGTSNISTSGAHQPLHGGGNADAWLVKFDAAGNRLWGTYYGGPGHDVAHACATDCNGNIYLSGGTTSASAASPGAVATTGAQQTIYGGSYEDGYLVKFNSAGVRQWSTLHGSTGSDQQYGCDTDVGGNVYVAGYLFDNTAPITGTNIATPGSHQTFMVGPTSSYLAKFNTNGQKQWGTYYGFDGTSDTGGAMACSTHSSGNVYMAGLAPNPFMPGTFTYVATPGSYQPAPGAPWNQSGYYYDGFLVRFYEVTTTPTTVVNVSSSNSVVCAGNSVTLTASGASNYSWSPVGTGTTVIVSPTINTTFLVTAPDACKAAVYTQSVVPLPNVQVTTNQIEICKGETATLTASGATSYVWQPSGSGPNNVVTPAASSSYTVTGTGAGGCTNTASISVTVNKCVGINDNSGERQLSIYPNPAKNTLTIVYTGLLTIRIYNEMGQLISTSVTYNQQNIDVSHLVAGIYLIKANDAEKEFVRKFVKD